MRKLIKNIVFLSLLIVVSCSNDEQKDLKNIISKGTAEYKTDNINIDTNYAYLVDLTDSKDDKYKFHFFSNIPISEKEFMDKKIIGEDEYGNKSIKKTEGSVVVFHNSDDTFSLKMHYNYTEINGYYVSNTTILGDIGEFKRSVSNNIEKINIDFLDYSHFPIKCDFEGVIIKYNIKLN